MSIYEQHFLGDYARIYIENVGVRMPPIIIGVLGWANAYNVEQARRIAIQLDIANEAAKQKEAELHEVVSTGTKGEPEQTDKKKTSSFLRRVVITYVDGNDLVALNRHNAPLDGRRKLIRPPDYKDWPFKECPKKNVHDPSELDLRASGKILPNYGWKLNDRKEIEKLRKEVLEKLLEQEAKKKQKKQRIKVLPSTERRQVQRQPNLVASFEKEVREAARLLKHELSGHYQERKRKKEKRHARHQRMKAERIEKAIGIQNLSVIVYQYPDQNVMPSLPLIVQKGHQAAKK